MFRPTEAELGAPGANRYQGLSDAHKLNLNNALFHVKSSKWDRTQMLALRAVPLDGVPLDRIIPSKFLTSIDESRFAYIVVSLAKPKCDDD
jgi:hypothetical protein